MTTLEALPKDLHDKTQVLVIDLLGSWMVVAQKSQRTKKKSDTETFYQWMETLKKRYKNVKKVIFVCERLWETVDAHYHDRFKKIPAPQEMVKTLWNKLLFQLHSLVYEFAEPWGEPERGVEVVYDLGQTPQLAQQKGTITWQQWTKELMEANPPLPYVGLMTPSPLWRNVLLSLESLPPHLAYCMTPSGKRGFWLGPGASRGQFTLDFRMQLTVEPPQSIVSVRNEPQDLNEGPYQLLWNNQGGKGKLSLEYIFMCQHLERALKAISDHLHQTNAPLASLLAQQTGLPHEFMKRDPFWWVAWASHLIYALHVWPRMCLVYHLHHSEPSSYTQAQRNTFEYIIGRELRLDTLHGVNLIEPHEDDSNANVTCYLRVEDAQEKTMGLLVAWEEGTVAFVRHGDASWGWTLSLQFPVRSMLVYAPPKDTYAILITHHFLYIVHVITGVIYVQKRFKAKLVAAVLHHHTLRIATLQRDKLGLETLSLDQPLKSKKQLFWKLNNLPFEHWMSEDAIYSISDDGTIVVRYYKGSLHAISQTKGLMVLSQNLELPEQYTTIQTMKLVKKNSTSPITYPIAEGDSMELYDLLLYGEGEVKDTPPSIAVIPALVRGSYTWKVIVTPVLPLAFTLPQDLLPTRVSWPWSLGYLMPTSVPSEWRDYPERTRPYEGRVMDALWKALETVPPPTLTDEPWNSSGRQPHWGRVDLPPTLPPYRLPGTLVTPDFKGLWCTIERWPTLGWTKRILDELVKSLPTTEASPEERVGTEKSPASGAV